jgi:2-phospho-L-lactate guanylyltransferase
MAGTTDEGATDAPGSPSTRAVVLVPVKAFTAAKGRLAGVLDGPARAALARSMAEVVVAAAAPLPVVVVCDDPHVASWAEGVGATVMWTEGLGLNGAVDEGVRRLSADGVQRVVVAHADLPFAAGLSALADVHDDAVVLVPDRRHDGTNVASVPTGHGFSFHYGAGSLAAHRAESERVGLPVRVLESEVLGWDVDEPADLRPPEHLGRMPMGGPA